MSHDPSRGAGGQPDFLTAAPVWRGLVALLLAAVACPAAAAQLDILGPAGSVAFGTDVAVLPNGNIVVTDPGKGATNVGAAYLYSPAGVLISTLSGSTAGDQVGSGGITVLGNGNYLIRSPNWHSGGAANAGALTWANGTTGVSGTVSATNSLVGSSEDDFVGSDVVALTNGNYVALDPNWDNVAISDAGAVTWGNGGSGAKGAVSISNSLIGTTVGDQVGRSGITALSNGNFVVVTPTWNNGAIATSVGAVTWVNGASGLTGAVSAINSLVGTTENDFVGGVADGSNLVIALSNGNYAVASPNWNNTIVVDAGAVTWGNGGGGTIGPVLPGNSLVGSLFEDFVGSGRVIALGNGNYVVNSPNWDDAATQDVGAVTWRNGSGPFPAVVSFSNSLIGSTSGDQVGSNTSVAVGNGKGNYVVMSPNWDNGTAVDAGAVTWANGSATLSAEVSLANSLVGTTQGDGVGGNSAEPLTNGNYVVYFPEWDNGGTADAGAATWGSGNAPLVGVVSPSNSLVGSSDGDNVAGDGVTALSNGNYVVRSPNWDDGGTVDAGAVTWVDGTTGLAEAVSSANSLVGTTGDESSAAGVTALSNGNYVVSNPTWVDVSAKVVGAVTWGDGDSGTSGPVEAGNSLTGTRDNDLVGSRGVTALANGNYVVVSDNWSNAADDHVGAVTWVDGGAATAAEVSPGNSLVGTTTNDFVVSGVTALVDGNYAMRSSSWDNVATSEAGVVSLGRGSGGLIGPVVAANSVRGTAENGGIGLVFGYDAVREQLAVGRPASNTLSLFTLPGNVVFANGFE